LKPAPTPPPSCPTKKCSGQSLANINLKTFTASSQKKIMIKGNGKCQMTAEMIMTDAKD